MRVRPTKTTVAGTSEVGSPSRVRPASRAAAVLATVGAVAGLALTSAPAAQAAQTVQAADPCISIPERGPNLDDGYGVMKGSFNLKNKPKINDCNVRRMYRGQVLYFNCWRKNNHGNLWVYGRVKGTRTYGWMSVANFSSVHGSSYPICNWNASKDHI
ncbi:hypothetical protein [Nonomuraea sp. NPDC050783]|uniref:hypothetical protein n=1 Tax=Nonomuraea sp. NPDC050783 TaxID=3154634 RepID=UPI0034659162